jgi:hypothetical protein
MMDGSDFAKGEEIFQLDPGIIVNPPPSEACCECCGRHISQLKPYGGAGDPLEGDFTGCSLVKVYRRYGPYDEEAERAYLEASKHEDPCAWMKKQYGKEKTDSLLYSLQLYGLVGSSWECRDCAILDTDEYHERVAIRRSKADIKH